MMLQRSYAPPKDVGDSQPFNDEVKILIIPPAPLEVEREGEDMAVRHANRIDEAAPHANQNDEVQIVNSPALVEVDREGEEKGRNHMYLLWALGNLTICLAFGCVSHTDLAKHPVAATCYIIMLGAAICLSLMVIVHCPVKPGTIPTIALKASIVFAVLAFVIRFIMYAL